MNDHELQRPLSIRSRSRPRRSNSTGRQTVIQIHASNIVKKLGIFKNKIGSGTFFKPDSSKKLNLDTDVDSEDYFIRKTRSLDVLRSKPYMSSPMLAVGFKSQELSRQSADGSHESGSTGHGAGNDTVKTRDHAKKPSIASGLAVAAMVAEASLRPTEARPNGIQHTSGATCMSNSQNAGHVGSAPLSLPEKRPGHPRLSTLPPLNFNLKGLSQDQRPTRFSPSVIVRPPPFPILELPALPTPIADTHESGSQDRTRTRRGTARLNSMPMLPMEGADERENDPDHENYGLDEDEEGEDDDDEETAEAVGSEDEDEDTDINGRTTADAGRSRSSTVNASSGASFLSRPRGSSLRLQLPVLNTPSLSSLLGMSFGTPGTTSASASNADAGFGSARSEEAVTPTANRTSQIGKADYFTVSSDSLGPAAGLLVNRQRAEDIDRTRWGEGESSASSSSTSLSAYPHHPPPAPLLQSSSALRTPTARDRPPLQSSMFSVAPPPIPSIHLETGFPGSDERMFKDNLTPKATHKDVPHLNALNTPKRPGVYHHASKSMIELFSTASAEKGLADAIEVGAGAKVHDIKGKGKLDPEEPVSNLQTLSTSPTKGKLANDQMDIDTLSTCLDSTAKGEQKALPVAPTTAAPKETVPSLRRQRSMPTFSSSGPPPPYPSFSLPEHFRKFRPLPREDEGKEELPRYSNDIKLVAIMPRKMEFAAPGVPARDRKWRRVHCVLEGTAFRVYDAPPRVSGVSALGGWWEKKVGVGDMSSSQGTSATAAPGATTNIVIGRKEPKKRMKWEEELQAQEASQTNAGEETQQVTAEINISGPSQGHKSKRSLASTLLHPHRAKNSLHTGSSSTPVSPRSSFQSSRPSTDTSAPCSTRQSFDAHTPVSSSTTLSPDSSFNSSTSLSGLSTGSSASSSGTPSRWRGHMRSDSAPSSATHSRSNSRAHSLLNSDAQSPPQDSGPNLFPNQNQTNSTVPKPDEEDLIRVYSLQRAESGLASDYMKRNNVVRVRMEGEQFLLQCQDVAGVVKWIEGFQAATNIALDLDERPMPKGPIFPRRRRRRRVQRTESGTDQTVTEPAAGSGVNETSVRNE